MVSKTYNERNGITVYDFLLTKKNEKKIYMLKLILAEIDEVQKESLKEKLCLAKTSFSVYFAELSEELNACFSGQVHLCNSKFGYYLDNPYNYSYGYILDHLRDYYIQESPIFQCMISLIRKDFSSTQQFADELKISISGAYSYLETINEFLSRFNCSINWKVSGNFEGSEVGIRFFVYYLYSTLFKSIKKNPFSKKLPIELTDIFMIKQKLGIKKKLSSSQEFRLRVAYGITMYRILYRKAFIDLPDLFFESIEFYQSDFLLPLNPKRFSENLIQRESQFFSFIVRGLIFDIDNYSDREEFVKKYHASSLLVDRLTTDFLSDFSKKFGFKYTQKSYIESYCIILPTLIYYEFINFDFSDYYLNNGSVDFDNSTDFNSKLYYQYSLFLKNYFSEHNLVVSKGLIEQNIQILFFLHTLNKKYPSLKINVQYSINIYVGRFIEKRISDIFSNDSIEIVSDVTQADIVISDSFIADSCNFDTFYIDNVFDKQTWNKLNKFLVEKIENNLPWLLLKDTE